MKLNTLEFSLSVKKVNNPEGIEFMLQEYRDHIFNAITDPPYNTFTVTTIAESYIRGELPTFIPRDVRYVGIADQVSTREDIETILAGARTHLLKVLGCDPPNLVDITISFIAVVK